MCCKKPTIFMFGTGTNPASPRSTMAHPHQTSGGSKAGSLPQPLVEVEEATKAATRKIGAVARAVSKAVVSAEDKLSERSERGRPGNGGGGSSGDVGEGGGSGKSQDVNSSAATAEGSSASEPLLPSISEDEEVVADLLPATESAGPPPEPPEAAKYDSTPSAELASESTAPSGSAPIPAVLLIYTAILSAYQAWSNESSLLSNQVPLSAVFPLILVAFLLGYNLEGILSGKSAKRLDRNNGGRKTPRRQRGTRNMAAADDASQTSGASWDEKDSFNEGPVFFSRTRAIVRRGRTNLARFGRRYVKKSSVEMSDRTVPGLGLALKKKQMFWSSLALKGNEKKLEKEVMVVEGALMDHLLKYKDFGRHKTERKVPAIKAGGAGGIEKESQQSKVELEGGSGESDDIAIGKAPLNNTRAESLETDEKFAKVVDPLCELRGMDLFLTDDPEEDIWSQPLLIQCGLRDTPTLVCNLMMPFGNMTAYFKLPDWFDDWSNIPEEKEDDPEDVKALKRFFLGDDEYRKARAKVVPFVVDGPLAIRLIKPAPMEVHIDGPRHPNTWTAVPKRIDPASGEVQHAIMELDVDLFSSKAIRKIINIIRPHLQSITIDVAIIISKPHHEDEDEPCACVGLWRIEKVDFEQCAVFPELAVEEAADKVKMLLSQMEGVAVEPTGGSGRRPGIVVAA